MAPAVQFTRLQSSDDFPSFEDGPDVSLRPPRLWLLPSARNPEQARRWMQWAWLGGLAWWVWNAAILFVWLAAPILAAEPGSVSADAIPGAKLVIYSGVEAFVIGMLAFGVRQRWRLAALVLAIGFFASRIVLIAMGLITISGARDVIWLVIYGGVLFLFVRGLQGTLSYHWFTHVSHPVRHE